ncbi:MAG: SH3 domain-containing protein [Planctomycetota bacterium]
MRALFAAFTLLIGAGTALAEEAAGKTTQYAGEVTASSLRLRAGPGESYQEVARLKKGARLVVHGVHAQNPDWLRVEVPQGYKAWVHGDYLAQRKDRTGVVKAGRLLIRPRPTTRYHQLTGSLQKDEVVRVLGRKQTAEGVWLQIQVPRRVPLFAHADFIKKIGPAELAEPRTEGGSAAPTAPPADPRFPGDQAVQELRPLIRKALDDKAGTTELGKLQESLVKIDRKTLSPAMYEQRNRLTAEILAAQKTRSMLELHIKKKELRGELERELAAIELKYQQRLEEIRKRYEQPRRQLFTATGVVRYKPDLFGKHPVFRLEEGRKLRYFLVSTTYDLRRFVNKRVGVTGLKDPESGTGHYTIIIHRLEILGDK